MAVFRRISIGCGLTAVLLSSGMFRRQLIDSLLSSHLSSGIGTCSRNSLSFKELSHCTVRVALNPVCTHTFLHTKATVHTGSCGGRWGRLFFPAGFEGELLYLDCLSHFRVAAVFHTEMQLDMSISSGNWDSTSVRTSLSLVSM